MKNLSSINGSDNMSGTISFKCRKCGKEWTSAPQKICEVCVGEEE